MLGTKSGLTVAAIAQELGVSERTIRNDIRQLNEDLGDGASIEGVQGRYSLRIFDPDTDGIAAVMGDIALADMDTADGLGFVALVPD